MDLPAYLSSKGIRTFKAAGAEVTAHCFFCDDGDPKGKGRLYINTDSWLYSCKRCLASGNRVTLLQHFGDQDRDDLAWTPGTDPALRRKALTEAADLAMDMLYSNPKVLQYLLDRGLSEQTIVDAKLGYVPTNWGLGGMLRKTNAFADLKNAGIVTAEGQEFFSGHIVIPYLSHGVVMQLRGRAYVPGKDLPGAKYVTPAGDNARLYNIDSLQGARDAVVIEGEFDALIVQQHLRQSSDAALRNTAVVGLAGAGTFPSGFVGYFEECRKVYFALDPDEAGMAASERGKEVVGTKVRVAHLPDSLPKCDWTMYLTARGEKNPHGGHGWRDIQKILHDADAAGRTLFTVRDAYLRWAKVENEIGGVQLGLPDLDRHIAPGLKPGQLMVPIARTGAGKTAFLASLSYNVRQRPQLVVSLEMTAAEYYDRLRKIAHFHNPLWTDDDIDADLRLLRIYDQRIAPGDLPRLAEEFADDVGVPPQVVMLDYIGYAAKAYRGQSQYERVTNCILSIKEDAKHGQYALIAPHQAGRAAADGLPPRAEDARDSGAIEDTADIMVSLYRPSESDKTIGFNGGVSMEILKNRNGRKGITTHLNFSMASLVLVQKGTPESRLVDDENALMTRGDLYTGVRKMRMHNAGHNQQLKLVPALTPAATA